MTPDNLFRKMFRSYPLTFTPKNLPEKSKIAVKKLATRAHIAVINAAKSYRSRRR